MPTYEYVCRACGHEFERFQKISERPIRRCPDCGERKVERRISSGGGFVFKGPGFYATDYRKAGPRGRGTDGDGGGKKEGEEKGERKEAGDAGSAGGRPGSGSDAAAADRPRSGQHGEGGGDGA